MNNFLIGCVGKPSAGKSSFLNAATDANAKVGNYPFTTIEPNIGVTFYQTECPCKKYGKTEQCAPRYGKCENGTRFVPVKMLDVAGLVPGAAEGRGLGNKFLDDLRHAHILLHIVDASGRTNEKGEETRGYDPINDVDWLQDEIHSWIFNNLWKKWSSVVRRHLATKSSAAQTLQLQWSGYGANLSLVQETLDRLGIKEPSDLDKWDEEFVRKLVRTFMDVRFPTILVLNKIDLPEADNNVSRICQKYPDADKLVVASALAECFLRKMVKEGYVRYTEGSEFFSTSEDETDVPPGKTKLKPIDDKIRNRLEKLKDLVLFRYGSTGVQQAIKRAVDLKQLVPVYTVKNIHNFTASDGKSVFRDCMLVHPGTTVRELCGLLSPEMEKHFLFAEGPDGRRLGEDEVITRANNIIKFTLSATEQVTSTGKEKESSKPQTQKPASGGKKEKEED